MKFDEVLRSWKEWFEAENVRYAVAGGLAIYAWGRSRTTQDVDFIVDGTQRDRILAHAEAAGYHAFHISEGYSNHEHADEQLGRIDFIYVYGSTRDQLFSTAEPRLIVSDVILPVPRPEHLIAMKVAAIKNAPRRVPIDAPDIEYLLTLPGIDREKVREYFVKNDLLGLLHAIERHQP
jgi:hypothetical protein